MFAAGSLNYEPTIPRYFTLSSFRLILVSSELYQW